MIAHGKDIKIFCGSSNQALALDICKKIGTSVGEAEVGTFSDGEKYVSIYETVRGSDVFVIQSTCSPVNDNLMELLIMIDALRRASAGRIMPVRTARPSPAIRSPPSWWPTSSPAPAPTGCSRWTCTPIRSRAFSTSLWIT